MSATTASPVVTRSPSNRHPPVHGPSADSRHRRAPSGATSRASADGHRPDQQQLQQQYSPPTPHGRQNSTASQQQSLAGVARRDYESPNLPQVQQSARSSSRDHGYVPSSPRLRDAGERSSQQHQRSDSRGARARYSQDIARSAAVSSAAHTNGTAAHGIAPPDSSQAGSMMPRRGRTSIEMPETGNWAIQKTIGAGSMGKVKLARNMVTGEQVGYLVRRHKTSRVTCKRKANGAISCRG
jgi:serine/threonine protein kinase KIN1/2